MRRKKDPALRISQEAVVELGRQVFDASHPGPVLADFRMLLDFVGTEGVESTGKHHLLPLARLPELNSRLTKPMRVSLKRPQQRSLPYLNGLYLLLRATGLVRVVGAGSKARLALDADVLASWQSLSDIEQYFTLLEAWLIHASPAHLGERVSPFRDEPLLFDVVQVFARLHSEKPTPGEQVWKSYLTHDQVGQCHLPLLDLFGFAEVEQGPPDEKGAWRPLRVRPTNFGIALGGVLVAHLHGLEEKRETLEVERGRYGALRPALEPLFPGYRRTLTLPEQPFRDGIHKFRVSLGPAWRLIAIDGKSCLDELASAILGAFSFDSDHLYCFEYPDRFGVPTSANHSYMDEGPYAEEIEIGSLPLAVGSSMTFVYDFGDNWEFQVRLEEVAPPDPKVKKPKVLKKGGAAPEQYPSWD